MYLRIIPAILFLLFTSGERVSAQVMRALSNGFSIGRSTGISSNLLQITKSDSSNLIDIQTKNVSGDSSGYPRAIPDHFYTIDDEEVPFSIIINNNSNSGGSSQTRINNSVFSGHSHSIFLQ